MNGIRQASPWHYQTAPTGSSSSLVSPRLASPCLASPRIASHRPPARQEGAAPWGHPTEATVFFYAIIFCISLCISSMRPFCAGSSIMSFMAAM